MNSRKIVLKVKLECVIILICLSVSSCSVGQNKNPIFKLPELIPYQKNGLWGFCDKEKNIKIPCKYDHADLFDSFGLAQVYFADKNNYNMFGGFASNVGLINTKGELIVPFQSSENFSYTVIPDDGKNDSIYGIYTCYKFKNTLIVIGVYGEDLVNKQIFKGSAGGKPYDPKYNCYNRDGKKILNDSFYYTYHYQTENKVHYIIGEHKSSKKQSLFSFNGKPLNQLTFDKCSPADSLHFVGVQMTDRNSINSSGIYTINGKAIIDGLYEFRGKIGDFFRVDNRYYNYKLKKFAGNGFHNSHYHYQFFDDFAIVPDEISNELQFTILKQDLTTLFPGIYIKIEVDTAFKRIFLYQGKKINIGNFNGQILSKVNNGEEIKPLPCNLYKVMDNNYFGLWSAKTNNLIAPIKYKYIHEMSNKRFVLEDSAKMILIDSQGDFKQKDIYNRIDWSNNLGFRNDSAFYIYPNNQVEFVGFDVKYAFTYGNVVYYRIYRTSENGEKRTQNLYAWNLKTKSFVENLEQIEFRERFIMNDRKFVFVLKDIANNYKTGIVKRLTGIFNENGEVAIPPEFNSIEVYPNFLLARKGNTYSVYVLNDSNEFIVEANFSIPNNLYFGAFDPTTGLLKLLYDTKNNTILKGYMDVYGTKYFD